MKNKALFIFLAAVMSQSISSCEFKYREFPIEKEKHLFPKQRGLFNDFENIFTAEQEDVLEKKLLNFKKGYGKNIIVISVKSISPYKDFQQFAVDLGNYWNISKNSVMIVISKENKKISLSIAEDTDGITDEEGQNIVADKIVPSLKRDKYYDGVRNGINFLILKWSN